ncbi:ABC transporter substrate-binding protein [Synergistales bacterium]|nr:ABC transporter substrate-binding protein [Synergistales bacterium]
MKVFKNNKKFTLCTALCLLSLIVLTAVGVSAGEAASQNDKPKFVNGRLDKPFTLKVPTMSGFNEIYIGEQLGFYKEVGLDIEYTGSMTGSLLAQSVINGDNHLFGTGHILTIAKAREAGAKIKMVLQGSFDDPEPRKIHMSWLVKDGSPIKEAKDVIGKKVSIAYVGSCVELLFSEYLRQNGIKRDQVEWIVMPDGQAENALKIGEIDVAGIHAVFVQSALSRGGVHSLVNTWQIGTAAGNGSASSYSARAFSEGFIKENPDIVKAYIAATVKTQHWINKNYDDAIVIAAKYLKVDIDKAGGTVFPPEDGIDPAKVAFWIKMMEDNGFVEVGSVTDEVWTNDLNPYLSGEIKDTL